MVGLTGFWSATPLQSPEKIRFGRIDYEGNDVVVEKHVVVVAAAVAAVLDAAAESGRTNSSSLSPNHRLPTIMTLSGAA